MVLNKIHMKQRLPWFSVSMVTYVSINYRDKNECDVNENSVLTFNPFRCGDAGMRQSGLHGVVGVNICRCFVW